MVEISNIEDMIILKSYMNFTEVHRFQEKLKLHAEFSGCFVFSFELFIMQE